MALRMLSKIANSTHNSQQEFVLNQAVVDRQNSIGGLLEVYSNVNCTEEMAIP